MRHVPTLFKREMSSYLLSPIAFLIVSAFLGVAWVNFWELLLLLSRNTLAFSGRSDPLTSYVAGSFSFWLGLLVAIPALTMRLFAEERRSGTIESLLTLPVTTGEIVVSKWLAGVAMYLILLVPFAMYLPFLYHQGKYPFDVGPVIALGIGLTTLGMMFVSIGLFFSALTRNQIVAAIWTFVAMFGLILSQMVYQYAAMKRAPWADAVQFVSVLHQVSQFSVGRLDLRFPITHLSVTGFMLYLTTKVVDSGRES